MRRAAWPWWALATLATAGASGCGTGADARHARLATQRLYSAVEQRDGRVACAQLSPALREQLVADASGRPCPKAVLGLDLQGDRVTTVRVYATAAEARLGGGDTVFLGETKLGWRVEALGCKPEGPGPFDCEGES